MAWFIIARERKTWTKYLVQADNERQALEGGHREQYLGYLDGENTSSVLAGSPFESDQEALADAASYVEGR